MSQTYILPNGAISIGSDVREYIDRQRAVIKALVEALIKYRRAMEGFADAVRLDTSREYPWPAQNSALKEVEAALTKAKELGDV